jgi:hypothetical protein
VIRYVAYILVALIALALAGSVATVLGQGVVRCLAGPMPVYVTALDGVGAVGGHPPRIRAVFEGPHGGRPGDMRWAVVRFPQGWSRWAYISGNGLSRTKGPDGLAPGPHRFEVGRPEVRRRLDAVAYANAWIWPKETPVLWIDARAIVPEALAASEAGAAPAEPPETALAVIRALKALAGDWRPVYLVADEARPYDRVRRRLRQWGAPPGPTFWVVPRRTYGRLKGLQGVWPTVRGALVASDDLARAAKRAKVPVERVAPAGAGEVPAAAAKTWARTLDRLTAPQSTNPNPRR